ncbi:HlyD family type I secretion periplasmic adaptor subunit [Telmatospirillum siberiense]|uniref:HlyD family type I secretion periplasmic adaptor subunit n=1 Tax=Telmatospirillum siberiense TaxID=382514 RepID=UPI0013043A20|nr:HlyD family type I secretion periplasmic adaptor subunit [Telmatospirillum siberiense]
MPDAVLMHLEPLRRLAASWRAAWQMERLRPRLSDRTATELAFLPAVLEIVESPASPLGRLTSWIIMVLFASILAWSCLGRVDIHATALGRIIPAGKTKTVAAGEIAIVAAIHVRDGDRVTAGQVLVDLDRIGTEADTARLSREHMELVVTAARLRALLDGKDTFAVEPAAPELLAVHRQQLAQKQADHRAAQGALHREADEKEAIARGNAAEISRLVQTVPLLEERVRAKETLAAEGYGARNDFLQLKQELVDRRQQLETAREKLAETRAGLANVHQRMAQNEAQFRAEALAQLAEADQKAASLAQELAKAQDRDRQFRLTAPVDGVVQQLSVHAPGAVVSPGQPVVMIVPDAEGIAVEAALPNKDIGFVRPGQLAEIKIESFPFTRYGTVPGTVAVVSSDSVSPDADPTRKTAAAQDPASTGQSKEGLGATYAVRLRLDHDSIPADGKDVILTPGMAVTAEIKTGRRTVISYLLDPVLRYGDESFRER